MKAIFVDHNTATGDVSIRLPRVTAKESYLGIEIPIEAAEAYVVFYQFPDKWDSPALAAFVDETGENVADALAAVMLDPSSVLLKPSPHKSIADMMNEVMNYIVNYKARYNWAIFFEDVDYRCIGQQEQERS